MYAYNVKAKTNVALLVLTRADMLLVEDKSVHLSDAIENATQFIIENDVPICDYVAVKDKSDD